MFELEPTQEEMDKLASKLTEAVLQLRAGDMNGARATLNSADHLCGVRLHSTSSPVADHHLDALRYGVGVYKATGVPERMLTATEQLMKQRIAKQRMQEQMEKVQKDLAEMMNKNINVIDPFVVNKIAE